MPLNDVRWWPKLDGSDQSCRFVSQGNIEKIQGAMTNTTQQRQMSLNDRKCRLTTLDGDAKLTPLISLADWWVTRTLNVLRMTKETNSRCQSPLNETKCYSTMSDCDAKLIATVSLTDWSAKRTWKTTEASNDWHHTDIVKYHWMIENVT